MDIARDAATPRRTASVRLRDGIRRLQGGRFRWVAAALASAHLTVKHRSPVTISVDSEGHWKNTSRQGTFFSPELHAGSVDEQRRSVRDTWCHFFMVNQGETVLDVGAGIGDDALVFARMVGPTGSVIAVEAHPNTFRCLEKTVRANSLHNVQCVHCAASDEEGELRIADGANYLTSSVIGNEGKTVVPGLRLDDVVAQLHCPEPTFIKMNIEGAETRALLGMPHLLEKCRRVAISCHDFLADEGGDDVLRTWNDVFSILERSGFRIYPRRTDHRPWVPYYMYAERPELSPGIPNATKART